MSFKEGVEDDAHPASLVVEVLGGKDVTQRELHCKQLQDWYSGYAEMREMPSLFKQVGQEPQLKRDKHCLLILPLQKILRIFLPVDLLVIILDFSCWGPSKLRTWTVE